MPIILTDASGAVVSRHDYLAFGEEIWAGVGNRTTTNKYNVNDSVRQQFTGYERDTESALDYAQARYYNSKHGRFTSVDPLTASATIKNPQTFNRYSYALNSPYKFTDPLGLLAQLNCRDCGSRIDPMTGQELPMPWLGSVEGEALRPSPSPPNINLDSVQLVDSIPDLNKDGSEDLTTMNVIDTGNVTSTELTAPPGAADVNVNRAVSSLENGQDVFIRLRFSVTGDNRGSFNAPTLQSGVPVVSVSVPGYTPTELKGALAFRKTDNGDSLSVYFKISAGNSTPSSSKGAVVKFSVTAFYNDAFSLERGGAALGTDRKVTKNIPLLIVNKPAPQNPFLRPPASRPPGQCRYVRCS